MPERLHTRSTPDQTRDLTSRSMALRAASVNETERSVEATLATEQPVSVFDWQRYEVIDEVLLVEGMRLPHDARQVPLLENHFRYSLDSVLGSVRDVRREDGRIAGRLVFAAGDESIERSWRKVKDGHLTDVSVGYRADNYVEIPAGKTQTVLGRSYTAGQRTLRITTAWTIREASLVPIGADQAAKIRAEQAAFRGGATPHSPPTFPGKDSAMPPALRQYLESIGLRADASDADAEEFLRGLSGAQKAIADALRGPASPPAASAPPPAAPALRAEPLAAELVAVEGVSPEQLRADGARAERQRIDSLRQLAGDDVDADLLQRAISEGWDESRASREFLRHVRDRRGSGAGQGAAGGPAIHSRSHESDCTLRALEAAMVLRSQIPLDSPHFRTQEGQALMPAWLCRGASEQESARAMDAAWRYRQMSMLDLCREACRLDGRAIGYDRDEAIRTAVSGATLTSIFTTSVNATLLNSFLETPDSTAGAFREAEVADFKTNDRISLGKTGALAKLPRGGVADHATISDTKESYKIARYARQFVVDEQDIIDDAFGAIREMPMEIGMAARRLRPDLVYAILLANAALGADSVALFHASHNNLGTTGTALAAATLQTAVAAMAKQTQDSVNLNLEARYLFVPQDLRFTAEILIASAERIVSTSDGTYNPLQNLLQVRVDNRLGVAGVTDPATGTAYAGTATNYFLAADPISGKTIEIGYLRGSGRAPKVRSFVLDRGQYGIGWDCCMDIGAKALAYQGLYKANGSA